METATGPTICLQCKISQVLDYNICLVCREENRKELEKWYQAEEFWDSLPYETKKQIVKYD